MWEPGDITHPVCIDPDDPADNKTISRLGADCGETNLGPGAVGRAVESSVP